jgi:hypothetical protein
MSHKHKHFFGFDERDRCRIYTTQYTGDGNTDRLIATLRFKPTFAIVLRDGVNAAFYFWSVFNPTSRNANAIQAHNAVWVDDAIVAGTDYLVYVYPNGGASSLNVLNELYSITLFGWSEY